MAGGGFKTNPSDVNATFTTVTDPVWASLKSMSDGKFTVTVLKGRCRTEPRRPD